VYRRPDTSRSPIMTEETHDSEMTGGDETIIHSSSRTPGPPDTSITGMLDCGRLVRSRSKTPTPIFVSKEELNQFAGHLGGVLGRFSQQMAREQNSMYLDIGRLSREGQQQARVLGKLQHRLELGESILVKELNMFERAIDMLDQESKTIQAEIVAKVQVEFQAQQARQSEQAEYSQRQAEQLRDRILEIEEARANDNANYVSVINRHKEEHKEAARNQQGQHEAEMAKLHDILIDLKAQVGAISAQRSAAPTVVTDNRERPVGNTDGAKKKRSNPTPEQGGNGGGQLPPTTMHGAGDPDPDDGDNDDNDGQDPKAGPSHKEKGKGRERQDPETGDEEEDVVDVMAKAIARERLLHAKRPSDPPWVFKNMSHQDIGICLMAVQDFFERNSHQWTMETDRIKYAMGRMEEDDVAPFTDTYRKKMSGALG